MVFALKSDEAIVSVDGRHQLTGPRKIKATLTQGNHIFILNVKDVNNFKSNSETLNFLLTELQKTYSILENEQSKPKK